MAKTQLQLREEFKVEEIFENNGFGDIYRTVFKGILLISYNY